MEKNMGEKKTKNIGKIKKLSSLKDEKLTNTTENISKEDGMDKKVENVSSEVAKEKKNLKIEDNKKSYRYRVVWNKNFLEAMDNASNGIFDAAKTERNIKIQIGAAVLALVLGIVLNVSKVEIILLLMSISLVISVELLNTAIEKCADMTTYKFNMQIKRIKDIAAGAVLVSATFSLVIAVLVFSDKLILLAQNLLHVPRLQAIFSFVVILFIMLLGILVSNFKAIKKTDESMQKESNYIK